MGTLAQCVDGVEASPCEPDLSKVGGDSGCPTQGNAKGVSFPENLKTSYLSEAQRASQKNSEKP